MRNPRKLIPYKKLDEIHQLHQQGVPVLRLLRDFKLDMTGPHLTKLISFYSLLGSRNITTDTSNLIFDSLFPTWVYNNENNTVVQPDDKKYTGLFPYGKWEDR